MKKIITFCFFSIAMLIGTQDLSAQSNKAEISKEAVKQTKALSKVLDLESKQKDDVYNVLKDYLINKDRLKNADIVDKGSFKKLEAKLILKMESILTKSQFEKYKTLDEL